jgi:hypothetical protein
MHRNLVVSIYLLLEPSKGSRPPAMRLRRRSRLRLYAINCFMVLVGSALGCIPRPAQVPAGGGGGPVAPWRVFEDAGQKLAGVEEMNPGFESGSASEAQGWQPFGEGYQIDAGGGRAGGRALRLASATAGAAHGAMTTVVLNQREARPIVITAASRAENVTGEPDADYSLYLDLRHADGSSTYGETLAFAVGTHDWEARQRVLLPSSPVVSIAAHCLFRNRHTGTVWFDDVSVREVPPSALLFDGQLATAVGPPSELASARGAIREVSSGDGLSLQVIDGGGLAGVTLGGQAVGDPARAHLGGFFLRDVRARSGWIHPGGPLRPEGSGYLQTSDVPELGLRLSARYAPRADRIDVRAELADTRGEARAVTLTFALPLPLTRGWTWGDDIRRERPITGAQELTNQTREWDIGAVGSLSRYPWGAAWSPAGGIALAHGLTEPRVARFAANPTTGQLYVSFDLGLSPETARFPNQAWVEFTLYRFDPAWGFRAAAQGYYQRFPDAFTRRMRPEQEGVWLPFTVKSKIQRVAEFGFGVHELHDMNEVASDELLGIASFRYLQIPDSYLLGVDGAPAPPLDPGLEPRVMAKLRAQQQGGTPLQKMQAEAILSAAFHDGGERPIYRWAPKGEIPWCQGAAGCAVFPVSADPEISDPRYPTNKAQADWNSQARALHERLPELDGAFVDGVQASTFRLMLDQRRSHLAVSRQPPTFMGQGRAIGIPSLFATVAFLQWLDKDVHGRMARLLMGNTVPEGLPWGADVFDYLGVETNWLPGGKFVPDDDAIMSYRRTLTGKRPFGLLQNADFVALGKEGRVERYFQIALFYGFYPSFFSADAANNPYWENPTLYNRDRPLFVKYVPLVRKLSAAGWEVLTLARASDPQVHLERWGSPPDLHFTVRNTSDRPVEATIRLDPALNLPAGKLTARRLIAAGPEIPVGEGGGRSFTLSLPAGAVEAVEVK